MQAVPLGTMNIKVRSELAPASFIVEAYSTHQIQPMYSLAGFITT